MVPKKNWTASRAHACVPGRESGLRLPAAAAGADQIQLEPKNLQDAPKTSTTEDTEGHRGNQLRKYHAPCASSAVNGLFSLEFIWVHFSGATDDETTASTCSGNSSGGDAFLLHHLPQRRRSLGQLRRP